MDILFHNRKRFTLESVPHTINDLILLLKEKELSERPELFVDGSKLWVLFPFCDVDAPVSSCW